MPPHWSGVFGSNVTTISVAPTNSRWNCGFSFLMLEIPFLGWLAGNRGALIDRCIADLGSWNKVRILDRRSGRHCCGSVRCFFFGLRKEFCKRLLSSAAHDPFVGARKRAAAAIGAGNGANANAAEVWQDPPPPQKSSLWLFSVTYGYVAAIALGPSPAVSSFSFID